MDQEEVSGTAQEKRLYELIWKRTIASQMADAELERTTVSIKVSNTSEVFQATGEVIKFDGFLRVITSYSIHYTKLYDLEKLDIDGFNFYVEKLADFIINKNAKVKSHYQTILKWHSEDSKA